MATLFWCRVDSGYVADNLKEQPRYIPTMSVLNLFLAILSNSLCLTAKEKGSYEEKRVSLKTEWVHYFN